MLRFAPSLISHKTKMAVALLVFIITGVLSYPACAEVLEGAVQLDDELPSLDRTLAPGNTFDAEIAKALIFSERKNINEWYRIPAWLAGSWETKEAVRTYSRNDVTGAINEQPNPYKCENIATWGDQYDRNFDVWAQARTGKALH